MRVPSNGIVTVVNNKPDGNTMVVSNIDQMVENETVNEVAK